MSQRVFRVASVTLGAAGIGLLGARWWVNEQTKDLPRSKSHDEASALMHYLMFRFFKLHGSTVASVLEHDARHIARVQENLLLSLMRSHDTAELPKSFNIHLAINPETFRENVPLTRYATYAGAVQRTLDGEPGLLLSPRAPATMVACTAGTSGAPKWLPVSRNQQEFHSMYSTGLTYGTLFGWVPASFSLRKTCRVLFPGEEGTSKAGIPMGVDAAISTSGSLRRAPAFTTPEAALTVADAEAVLYLHLLFALRDEETSTIHADYGPAVVGLLAQLDDPATRARLLADLEAGSVAPHLDIPVPARVRLEEGLKPDKRRAAAVRRALAAHDARGGRTDAFRRERAAPDTARPPLPDGWSSTGALATDLWPHLTAVVAGMAGPLAPSRRQLRRRYLPPAADVPILDPVLQSTEALLGGNLAPFDDGVAPPEGRETFYADAAGAHAGAAGDPTSLLPRLDGGSRTPADTAFVLLPQSCFLEFVPEASLGEQQPATLLLHELSVGDRYEVVATTKGGLWRYRTGDVVRVVGLDQGALPVVTLSYRADDSVRLPAPGGGADGGAGASLTTEQLLAAAGRCEASWAGKPGRQLLCVDEAAAGLGAPDRVDVFLDVSGSEGLPPGADRDVDEALRAECPGYDAERRAGRMRQARAVPTAAGAFARRWRAQLRTDGVRATIHKPRRLVASAAEAEALVERA